ncbi:Nucleoside-diphosphate-sugar epimerase [Paraoerskovia marina]|uniref:Nucleoside-diphosphate-sugar epimerase n=1 Tax=Paraoerskovia marina TaxID=545619 RepID=A0A1H1MDA9_9CELL|nr:NAD-dependent epimerase/dehydratase family protein [Paraoerskovia marina]SDR84657.1 Nucleoside-diphosphate-sugar epimerase [Paraoerskovia marina]
MRLLVLGGTRYVGRAIAADAVARGWDVSVLNRGTQPLPDGVTHLAGDRTRADGLGVLDDAGSWDVVVDTWEHAPRVVHASAHALSGRTGRYLYISSRSVYDHPPAGAREDHAVVDADPQAGEEVSFAQRKRGAELAVAAEFGERASVLRPGLVLGPDENMGRLLWWLARAVRGGRILSPGPADSPIQHVDARDLARFALDQAERDRPGVVDVVGPSGPVTTERLLQATISVTAEQRHKAGNPAARLDWVDPESILDAGVSPWTELPIWLPPGPDHDALHRSDVSTALDEGMTLRPIESTVAETWDWMMQTGPDGWGIPSGVGLDPARERQILDAELPRSTS